MAKEKKKTALKKAAKSSKKGPIKKLVEEVVEGIKQRVGKRKAHSEARKAKRKLEVTVNVACGSVVDFKLITSKIAVLRFSPNAGLQLGDLPDATWSEPISRNNPGHAKYDPLHRRSW